MGMELNGDPDRDAWVLWRRWTDGGRKPFTPKYAIHFAQAHTLDVPTFCGICGCGPLNREPGSPLYDCGGDCAWCMWEEEEDAGPQRCTPVGVWWRIPHPPYDWEIDGP